jgi:S-adenosylmethionine:tRNA ribosyltransferase-isomerase
VVTVELAVGLDTFRPVMVDRLDDHVIHTEWYRVPEAAAAAIEAADRVVAVGTTAVRAIETWAATGEREGRSSLFIRRPYDWQVVDLMMTNFHLPGSTLLCLVDAFVGPRWRDLYATALDDGYRFLSFGDCMILGTENPRSRTSR